MAGDHVTLLRELHNLRAFPSIGPFRVDDPIALDVRWRLLRDHDTAEHKHQEREAEKQSFCAVCPHASSDRGSCGKP